MEVAFGQQREARHVGGRGPLAAEKLRPRLPRVTVPQEIARAGSQFGASRIPPCSTSRAPLAPPAEAGAARREQPDEQPAGGECPEQRPGERRAHRSPGRQPHDRRLAVQEDHISGADHDERRRDRDQPARHGSGCERSLAAVVGHGRIVQRGAALVHRARARAGARRAPHSGARAVEIG